MIGFPYRAKLEMIFTKDAFIPFSYHHDLMGAIYKAISHSFPALADSLHTMNNPKPFTFSWIRGKPAKVGKEGIFYNKSSMVKLIVSTWKDYILDALGMALLENSVLRIGTAVLEIVRYSTYTKNISGYSKFVLLSPIVLSVPVLMNGKLYHRYLDPRDPMFGKRLVDNLKRKYELYVGGDGAENMNVSFFPDQDYISRKKTSKLIDIKGTKVRAHIFPFVLEGDKELIEFGYYAGFGERTAQGFGCAELLEEVS